MMSFRIEHILLVLAVLFAAMLAFIVISRNEATEDAEETESLGRFFIRRSILHRDILRAFGSGSPETQIKQDMPELKQEVQGSVEMAQQQSTCVICLDTVDVEQPVRKLRCSHAFHPQCILNWCLTQAALECPVCRDREPLGELGKAQGGEEQA